jgi:glycosyltransferase involved in cell wall biosynthesis
MSEKDEGPYFAMNKAAQLASGRWIIFMNAGDWFLNEESIANAVRYAPDDVDFVIGHHIYRNTEDVDELHKANDFEESWNILREGTLTGLWLQGIPGHQATFTRTALLREHGYDTTFRIAADHDFMYRMKRSGCTFYHCGIPLSIYTGGGFSARNFPTCVSEWERTCAAHSGKPGRVREFFRGMLPQRQGERESK